MIRSIEGLRGVAALLVVFFHSYGNHWGGVIGQQGIVKYAFLFVDMFFVISGFVMASVYGQSLRNGRELGGFMLRRFFRLYPLHLVMTFAVPIAYLSVQLLKLGMLKAGMSIGSEAPFSRPVIDMNFLPLEVLLLNGVGLYWAEIGNYPSWSVSVEFWMYVLFALMFFAVRGRRARVVISLMFVLSSMAYFWWMWNRGPWMDKHSLDEICMPRGFMGFFSGILVFYVWERTQAWFAPRHHVASDQERAGEVIVADPAPRARRTVPDVVLGLLQLLAAALVYWMVSNQPRLGDWQLALPVVFSVLVFLLLADRGVLAHLLNTRPLQWLGRLSFSIYLGHVTVMTPLDVFGRTWPEPRKHIIGVVYFIGVFVLATLTHRYIEVPWRARGKRIADRIEGRTGRASPPDEPAMGKAAPGH